MRDQLKSPAKEMHIKTFSNSERSKTHVDIRVNDSHDRGHEESKSDTKETNHHGTEQLPNVSNLMQRHSIVPGFDTDACHNQTKLETCDVDAKEIKMGSDDRTQQFVNIDVKYNDGESAFDKTAYLETEQREVKNDSDRTASYGHPKNNTTNERFGQVKSEVSPLASASIRRDMSDQKLEQACSVQQTTFSGHSQMPSSMHHLEPLSLVIEQSDKNMDVAGRSTDTSSGNDAYENDVSAWEQENDRFVHYTWRNDVYAQNTYIGDNSGDDSHANTLLKSSGFSNNMMTGSNFSQTFLGDGSCVNLGLNSRRRRRRVQTPVQRSAANMRERRRMCHLNVAFDRLKEHLPSIKHKQKLSRIQTLKAAIDYINLLQESLSLC